jgi:hypothetical protein
MCVNSSHPLAWHQRSPGNWEQVSAMQASSATTHISEHTRISRRGLQGEAPDALPDCCNTASRAPQYH